VEVDGTVQVHRIPPLGLKCLSERRREEITALLGGEQGRRGASLVSARPEALPICKPGYHLKKILL